MSALASRARHNSLRRVDAVAHDSRGETATISLVCLGYVKHGILTIKQKKSKRENSRFLKENNDDTQSTGKNGSVLGVSSLRRGSTVQSIDKQTKTQNGPSRSRDTSGAISRRSRARSTRTRHPDPSLSVAGGTR